MEGMDPEGHVAKSGVMGGPPVEGCGTNLSVHSEKAKKQPSQNKGAMQAVGLGSLC